MTESFGARVRRGFDSRGPLCVGIDPHPWLLDEWGLRASADGVREFGERVVDAAASRVAFVKPQVAFFERFGSAGIAALERVLEGARAAGLVVIADAKRGDIGSSVEAYGLAWLSPGSPLETDAVTVSPYLGAGALEPVVDVARSHGKGLFVLAATSNPEARSVQSATVTGDGSSGRSVAASIVGHVAAWNATSAPLGDVGVVLGATVDMADFGLDADSLERTPVLAPGFGAQGAGFDSIRARYGDAATRTLVSVSRSVLAAGPRGLASAIEQASAEIDRCLA